MGETGKHVTLLIPGYGYTRGGSTAFSYKSRIETVLSPCSGDGGRGRTWIPEFLQRQILARSNNKALDLSPTRLDYVH